MVACGRPFYVGDFNEWSLYLKPEADCEDKGADARDEPGEEGVEGEGADEAAVDELHDPGEEDVGEVAVYDLEPLRSVVDVLVEELGHDGANRRGRGGRGRGGGRRHGDNLHLVLVFGKLENWI